MPQVLEKEQVKGENAENQKGEIASWVAEIPAAVIHELGLPRGTELAVTIRNGKVSGDILRPLPPRLKEAAEHILQKNRKVYEELRRIGD